MGLTLQQILDRQQQLADHAEAVDPRSGTELDAGPWRDLVALSERAASAEETHSAVTAARSAGYSWRRIATALGESADSTQRVYGPHDAGR